MTKAATTTKTTKAAKAAKAAADEAARAHEDGEDLCECTSIPHEKGVPGCAHGPGGDGEPIG